MRFSYFITSFRRRILRQLLFSILTSALLSADPFTGEPPYAIRISCGSEKNTYTSVQNYLWSKDAYYSGGSAANISVRSDIAPQLNTLRYFQLSDGPENCYNVSVANGLYVVRLFFAFGPIDNSNREPLFDFSLEGTQVYSLKKGWSYSRDLSYAESRVWINDGSATACFHSTGHGNPSVMSVEILQISDDAYDLGPGWAGDIILRTVKRVNCGSTAAGYGADYNANPWGGDRFWATDMDLDKGISSPITTTMPISGVSSAPNFFPEVIYQTAATTAAMASLSYTFEVEPNENYSIWLHFAEIYPGIRLKEQRVFDVSVNKEPLFTSVDIIGLAGSQFTAVVLNRTVTVDGRILTLTFTSLQGGILINAFEIFQVIRTEYTTAKQPVWALQALKHSLGLPSRFGWNGDPCVPQEHPWSGVDCQFSYTRRSWFIDGLDLDNQGLKGYITDDVALLEGIQNLNLSGNGIYGKIPSSIGSLTTIQFLDLSYNRLQGSIPDSLGRLTQLRKLFLNGNMLSGKVPVELSAGPIHGASFNFSGNLGLCGVPGFSSCDTSLSSGSKAGIAIGTIIFSLLISTFAYCIWKRQKNIARAQRISASRDAPYAKSRTAFSKELQMSKPSHEPYVPHYMQHL
eukprot:c26579_g1_i1 orf=581-2470(+)